MVRESDDAGISCEDERLAVRLVAILRAEDPEAFLDAGDEVQREIVAVDGHWYLPRVISKLRREMAASDPENVAGG